MIGKNPRRRRGVTISGPAGSGSAGNGSAATSSTSKSAAGFGFAGFGLDRGAAGARTDFAAGLAGASPLPAAASAFISSQVK